MKTLTPCTTLYIPLPERKSTTSHGLIQGVFYTSYRGICIARGGVVGLAPQCVVEKIHNRLAV